MKANNGGSPQRHVECRATFVPVEMRQTGTRGVGYGIPPPIINGNEVSINLQDVIFDFGGGIFSDVVDPTGLAFSWGAAK
jgi:hypothetical protein